MVTIAYVSIYGGRVCINVIFSRKYTNMYPNQILSVQRPFISTSVHILYKNSYHSYKSMQNTNDITIQYSSTQSRCTYKSIQNKKKINIPHSVTCKNILYHTYLPALQLIALFKKKL